MHGILKSVQLGKTKQNEIEQKASKIENVEGKLSYIDMKSNLQLQIRNYALNPFLALLRNLKSQGQFRVLYLIDY